MRKRPGALGMEVSTAAVLALSVAIVFGSAAAARTFSSRSFCGLRWPGGESPAWLSNGRLAYIGPGARLVIRNQTQSGIPDATRVLITTVRGPRQCSVVARAPTTERLWGVRDAADRRLVYATDDFQLLSLDRATHTVTQIGTPESLYGAYRLFEVSRNGREVAFTGNAPCPSGVEPPCTRVGVVPAAGGPVLWLSGTSDLADSDPSFSPDGQQVVFQRNFSSLLVEPAGGGTAIALNVQGQAPAWSPTGQWIAFTHFIGSSKGRLQIVNPKTGQTRSLTGPVLPASLAYSWAPDGKHLAFVTNRKIGTVSLTGKIRLFTLPHRLLPAYDPIKAGPQWSPNGRTIALTLRIPNPTVNQTSSWIYLINPNGRHLRRLH